MVIQPTINTHLMCVGPLHAKGGTELAKAAGPRVRPLSLEPAAEVVGRDEVSKVLAQLIMALEHVLFNPVHILRL
ncbi:hypothetical protein [Mesorhizobium sp. ISC15]|uniref:hypothetical protein n=1 Tax=Mesorhizobium sp. ISC15 TaxID=3076429 RepID=UPI00301DC892